MPDRSYTDIARHPFLTLGRKGGHNLDAELQRTVVNVIVDLTLTNVLRINKEYQHHLLVIRLGRLFRHSNCHIIALLNVNKLQLN